MMQASNDEPLISIIIPVYNVEKYIENCLETVIKQTYKNIEIILVDDGSKDSSSKICDKYAKKDNRIRVIHKKNGGLSDARNVGTEQATGMFITYIDSDDSVTYDYVEYLYKLIKMDKDITFSSCNVEIVRKEEHTENTEIAKEEYGVNIFNKQQAFKALLYAKELFLSACGKLFYSGFIKKYKFPVGLAYEDTAVIYKWINDSNKIICGSKPCYKYYSRDNSISKQGSFNKNEIDYIKNTDEMLNFIKKNYPEELKAVNRFFIYANFRELRIILFSEENKETKEIEKKIWKNIKKYRIKVLLDNEASKRDKAAILISFLGRKNFKRAWKLYCKITGRKVND